MRPFLYLLRIDGGFSQHWAKATGLDAILTDGYRETTGIDSPDGRLVLVSTPLAPPGLHRFAPEEQEWHWSERGGVKFGVGYWREHKPREGDLRRKSALIEHSDAVALGDGGAWLIPRLRYMDGRCALPQALHLDAETGEAVRKPESRYSDLDALGERLTRQWELECRLMDNEGLDASDPDWDARVAAEMGAGVLTITDQVQLAYRALAVNYRIGPQEIGLLELVTEHTLPDIMGACLCRLHERKLLQILELEKKIRLAVEQSDALAGMESELDQIDANARRVSLLVAAAGSRLPDGDAPAD